MTKKYFKILSLGIRKSLSLEGVAKNILEYGLYFVFTVFLFKNLSIFASVTSANLNIISAVYLLFIYLYRLLLENVLVFRYLLVSNNFDLFLTKPINPLFRLMLNKIDLVGLLILLAIVVATSLFGNAPDLIPILTSLILTVSVFVFVLSFLLKSNGSVAFEKLLLSIFLVGFLGVGSLISGMPVLFTSILFLFISIKFWNFALTKYTSVSS